MGNLWTILCIWEPKWANLKRKKKSAKLLNHHSINGYSDFIKIKEPTPGAPLEVKSTK